MQVIFYNTVDSANVINKTLTNSTAIEINFKSDVDILNPEIVLLDDGNYAQFNYCHIPLFNRYYYCEGYERLNANLIKLRFSCDVLETYKTDILNSNARFLRGIKTGDYVKTSLDTSELKTVSTHASAADGFNGGSMIITTLGV